MGKEVMNDDKNENETNHSDNFSSVHIRSNKMDSCKLKFERNVTREGHKNFEVINLHHVRQEKSLLYQFHDVFTTLTDMKWRWTLFIFAMSYFGTWLGFAIIWYGILEYHGDFMDHSNDTDYVPCVTEIHTFTEAFLFSVETQQTTGYGYYHITIECADAVILLCMQSMIGCILEGLMVGLIFVKISEGKKRGETLIFSRCAVITIREGQIVFMFRVGDLRRSGLLNAHVRLQLVRKRVTLEGDCVPYRQESMEVHGEGENDNEVLLFWPTLVIHNIDEKSPLYNVSQQMLYSAQVEFEILVVLEGIVQSTGHPTQVCTSYLPSEILWGHRFSSMDLAKNLSGRRVIDFAAFNDTIPTRALMSSCSAKELNDQKIKDAQD